LRLVEWLDGAQHFGQSVNALRLEWLSAATAAIDAISGTIASLPAFVYRLTDAGRVEDAAHPLARAIRDGPNPHQTWPDFVQWLVAQTLRHGNGLAEQTFDQAGRFTGLRPLAWDRVAPKVLPDGRLVYDFSDPITMTRRRLLDSEVFHLRDRSDDGLIGRARHDRAHPVIASALALAEFAGNSYKNGAYPSGVLQTDAKIGAASLEQLRERFADLFSGAGKAAKVLVLDQGLKWTTVTATPEDLELLAARRFAIEEAARLYQVPPPIIGDLSHGTFTNSETLIRFFAQSTILTWARKIEAEVHRSIFTDSARRTRQFELDLSGLLRGDPETRWKSHEIALRNRVLTPNEIRELEGWNPRPGGDEFTAPPAAPAETMPGIA
jgi:HK97 family phage portal protein